MNTLQNLLDNGIDIKTGRRMLQEYSERIDTMNGIYKIVDINYDFSIRGKDVTLQCIECGKIIHRTMISGRNKWSELIKSCNCEKEKEKLQKEADLKNFQKIKKEQIFNDAHSLVGSRHGDYEIEWIECKEEKPIFALKCLECGNVVMASYKSVKDGAKKYQKCKKHYNQIKYDESYIGRKNNLLKVIGITRLPNRRRAFICECDCGEITSVEPTFWEQGIIKSCGCLAKSRELEHSEELDRLRRIYNGMTQRCCNKNSKSFKNYGGRGIKICDEWINDREKFIEWALSNGYSNELSIDRKDVNGNYCPENCRWATTKEQNQNKRNNVYITINNETKTLSEWSSCLGVPVYKLKKLL